MNLQFGTEGFQAFATNSDMKTMNEKIHDQPFECLNRYERPCSSLTFLTDAKTKRSHVSQVGCLSGSSLRNSFGRWVRFFDLQENNS